MAAAVAVVVGAFAFMSFSGRPNYTPLFTNLQPSDAANITSKLTSDKVPYQLADGGTTIMVPASDVDQERLSLAQAGLPATSTVGLSLLDKEGITSSNMTQQADYLQALQGELEQTIDSIQNVASSQVNIALPANQDFALSNDSPDRRLGAGDHAGRPDAHRYRGPGHRPPGGIERPQPGLGQRHRGRLQRRIFWPGPGVAEGDGGDGSQTDYLRPRRPGQGGGLPGRRPRAEQRRRPGQRHPLLRPGVDQHPEHHAGGQRPDSRASAPRPRTATSPTTGTGRRRAARRERSPATGSADAGELHQHLEQRRPARPTSRPRPCNRPPGPSRASPWPSW